MVAIDLLDMAVLRLTLAPSQHHSPVGQEHGRTIPLAVIQRSATLDQLPESIPEPKASGRKLGTVHLAQCCPRGKLTGAKDRASKFALHPLNYLCPVSDLLLSKQPRARVPWAVVSVQQPSPIAIVGQQNPDRFAHRTCKMRDARIGRNDKVRQVQQRCRIVEVSEIIAKPRDATELRKRTSVGFIGGEPTGGVRPNARENDQIRHSNTVWAAWNAGRRPFFESAPSSQVRIAVPFHVSWGFIRGIPVEMRIPARNLFGEAVL